MTHLLRLTARLWRAEKKWLLLGFAASLLALLSAIALLALSGWFITAAGLAGAAGAGLMFDFFRPSAGIRFFALFRTATRYAERIATHDATLRFITVLRGDLFAAVAEKRLRSLRNSELLQRLTGDLDAIDALYLRVLLPSAVAAALLLLACAVLAPIAPAIAIAVFAAFLLAAILLIAGARMSRKASRRMAFGTEALRVRSIDLVHAHTDLHFSGGIAAQKNKLEKASRYLSNATFRLASIEIAVSSALAALAAALTAAIVYLSATALEAGSIGSPVMVMLIIGGLAALEVFAPLRRGALEFGRIAFSGKRLEDLVAAPPSRGATLFAKQAPALLVKNVTYRRGVNSAPVLEDFSLEVAKGEHIVIAGKSGSGKSTLLSLIAGLLAPESGDIVIASPETSRPALGYLTQQTELFRGSIAENLRVAAPEASDAELWHALAVVELDHKVRELEQGLQWPLGESASGFSGGEARRLALARLVLRNPEIWLLDEPTAALDDALGRRVLANLTTYAIGATLIIAAHHEREKRIAGRVISIGGTESA